MKRDGGIFVKNHKFWAWAMVFCLTNHAKNSPTSIGGEMNWHKKLSLDHRKKIEYT